MTDAGAAVSHAKRDPLREFAPAPLKAQKKELVRQLAIVRNVVEKQLRQDRIHPGEAMAELQSLQSAVRSIEALEQLLGPEACPSKEELVARLAVRPAAEITEKTA